MLLIKFYFHWQPSLLVIDMSIMCRLNEYIRVSFFNWISCSSCLKCYSPVITFQAKFWNIIRAERKAKQTRAHIILYHLQLHCIAQPCFSNPNCYYTLGIAFGISPRHIHTIYRIRYGWYANGCKHSWIMRIMYPSVVLCNSHPRLSDELERPCVHRIILATE